MRVLKAPHRAPQGDRRHPGVLAGGAPAGARRALLRGLALGAALAFTAPAIPARAAPSVAEYRVKAAFLYKFLSYVEWPPGALASPGGAFVIGVVGPEAAVRELRRATAGQSVNGHAVSVRPLARGDTVADVHVLFLAGSDGDPPADTLAAARGRPVLTITESDIEAGAVINFVVVDDRVRFDIALPAADAHQLKISARLLNVARRVVPRS